MTGSKSFFRLRRRGNVWPTWLAALFIALLVSMATGEQTRQALFDGWQRLSPRDSAAPKVRVVLIDGESLSAVGPWPWSRYYLGRLTEDINRQGPKVIGFDVLFPEPDRAKPELFAKMYPELTPEAASEVVGLPSMDQLFGQVIGQSPVVIARAGASKGVTDPRLLVVDAQFEGTPPKGTDHWPAAITAIPELEDTALGHGLVNGQPDADGVVRSVPLIGSVVGRTMPGLALELARLSLDAETIRVSSQAVELSGRRIPIDPRGRMHFRFGEFPHANIVSARQVLGHTLPTDYFRDKIVLVGLAAEGTSDIVATPLASENFGVVVQAEAIDTILNGGWLSRPTWAAAAEWLGGALLALAALAVAWTGRWPRLALTAAFVAVPIASWLAFDRLSLLVDAVRPLEIGGAALAGVVVGLFADSRRERERLRNALLQEQMAAAKTEGELQAARKIQMSMVPPRSKLAAADPRLDADALLEPARSVGGDLYDLARLDDDRIGFLVGDVTGKGVPAALFMAMSKALTSFVLNRENRDLGAAVASVNEELLRGGAEALSVTMIIGVLDLRDGGLSLVCAGHEDPITVEISGEARSHRLDGGPPLGLVEYPYPVETLKLSPGDALLLVTDGITEAQDAAGALYGRDRLLLETASRTQSATALCEGLRDAVRTFEGGIEPTDDLTVMVLRYLGQNAER
ncbi:CHASE2 domain-containing protein [Sphingomonas hankyongi]|uniref:CHASE2 domain-containing protein n=1 Tax=Sphingomonas hankyongi TaxID=2908209 RepID=A0ABT0S1E5_9SPHN|nr:CHASE2 domain-containing protein [Sphingomonas hankyongi]MCL6729667.1 CHASE2 domain-containing protein [Sphingomonas hankyongi]